MGAGGPMCYLGQDITWVRWGRSTKAPGYLGTQPEPGRPPSLLRKEKVPDVGLGLLHDQGKARVDSVVDLDFAASTDEHHAPEAGCALFPGWCWWKGLGVNRQRDRQVLPCLCLNNLGVLRLRLFQLGFHLLFVLLPAPHLNVLLQKHEEPL